MNKSVERELGLLLSEAMASVREREKHAFDRVIQAVGKRVVLFGAGNLGRQCLACLRRSGIEPLAFADNNPRLWNTKVDGVQVLEPARAVALHGPSAAFVVAIWSLGHRYAETRARLCALGCSTVNPVASLRWKYSADLLPNFCCDLPHFLYEQADQVLHACGLWSDDYSRNEFLAQVKWRALGEMEALASPFEEESYFPESIFSLGCNEALIDCGAYDGDTIRSFLRQIGEEFRIIHAFEPDVLNFSKLRAYIDGLNGRVASRINAHRLAVGSRRMTLPFNMTGTEGSTADTRSSETVECVALDELVSNCSPTYLKMDIEGAEADALIGARSIIERHRPVLAVCVYHRQNDLWRIPILIRSLYPGYRLFLRPHEPDGWQLVCYAVPGSRSGIPKAGS